MKGYEKCVLTINGGSSSIKFSLYQIEETLLQLFYGNIENIGEKQTVFSLYDTITKQKESFNIEASNQNEATNYLIKWLQKKNVFNFIKAIGHRIVHGMRHTTTELISTDLLDELKRISGYDPEHSLIHRLTYRRTNHKNLHVRGYKGEGTTTTPFEMVVLNYLDRFHLVGDAIDRLPHLGSTGAYIKNI